MCNFVARKVAILAFEADFALAKQKEITHNEY